MSYYKAYAVAIASLLTGAAVVHNIYKPDLVTPNFYPVAALAKVSGSARIVLSCAVLRVYNNLVDHLPSCTQYGVFTSARP